MKVTKMIGVTAAVLTVISAGVAMYSKVKANKIKMDETIDPETKDELVEKTEKVTDAAIRTVTMAGTACAWAWAIFMFGGKSGVRNNKVLDNDKIESSIIKATRDFLQSTNNKFILDMTERGINMHGLTGQSNVGDALTIYQECYDKFVKTYGTGGDFTNDLADMLNIHSVFVRNDLADAMMGGVLYE